MPQADSDRRSSGKVAGIASALAAASAQLIAAGDVQAEWDVNTSLMFYQEADDRVQDLSFKSLASTTRDNDDEITVGLQLDTLTGASPSGALVRPEAQTFTRPSGRGEYTTDAGDQPQDNTFNDDRYDLSIDWLRPYSRDLKLGLGGSVSKEYDYLHLGLSAQAVRELNNKNTTLRLAIGLAQDSNKPVGGVPQPLSQMQTTGVALNRTSSDSKSIVDAVLGVTQVVSRRAVVQINYTLSIASGYLNDPYKFLSVIDPVSGEADLSLSDDRLAYVFEQRPDSRTGHNLYTEWRYRLDNSIANLSYRYHTDNWGIDSHTLEGRYRFLLDGGRYIEPHLRYYTQTEADFYTPYLANTAPLTEDASADYRLAAFTGATVGAKYGQPVGSNGELGFRLELYQTRGDDLDVPESLAAVNSYPDLSSVFGQVSYRFSW